MLYFSLSCLKHVRHASAMEKGGGYIESLACTRALQEAYDCLFL